MHKPLDNVIFHLIHWRNTFMCSCACATPHTSHPEQWNWKWCSLCEKRGKCELCMVWRTRASWRISCRKWLWGAQIRFPVSSVQFFSHDLLLSNYIQAVYWLHLLCVPSLHCAIITPFGHFLTIHFTCFIIVLFSVLAFMWNVKSLLTSISIFPIFHNTGKLHYSVRACFACILNQHPFEPSTVKGKNNKIT